MKGFKKKSQKLEWKENRIHFKTAWNDFDR